MIKITMRVLSCALLASVCIFLFAWCWFVLHKFDIATPWTTLPKGLMQTFSHPNLRPIAINSLAIGFIPMGLALYWMGDWAGNGERVLRGARLVTAKELAKRTRLRRRWRKPPMQVTVGGVPIPLACETGHLLLPGSTGTGKSTAIDELVPTALARGDRLIIVDPDGSAWARFSKDGDKLLNPFDHHAEGWCLFNEVRAEFDYDRLAQSVVPDSADPASQVWHAYAQQLLAEIMRAMMLKGENTTERLLHWLTAAPAAELTTFLAGSPASGLFAPGAEKALASTRFILSHHIGPHQYLRPSDFSLRTWLAEGKGNLYVTWRQDMLAAMVPLVSGWIDILMADVLTLPTANPRPLWLVLDELGSLKRLTSLEAAMTKGRKYGLRIVAGVQSTAQLEAIYGHANARTLLSCFRNVLVLGCSPADAETAKAMADGLGQVEVERMVTTYNEGQYRSTSSRSMQRSVESLVLPDELISLPPLHGYLKLAGGYPAARVQLRRRDHPVRIDPFKER